MVNTTMKRSKEELQIREMGLRGQPQYVHCSHLNRNLRGLNSVAIWEKHFSQREKQVQNLEVEMCLADLGNS